MKLRPMKMSDAELMLEWKNYPETRRFTIQTSNPITLANHLKWLPDNIQFFRIIEDSKVPCGAVRVQDKEISIWVDRALWGHGYASEAINKVAKKGYTAKIVDDNINSMRVFIDCGFKPISHQDGYYIFQK